MTPTPLQLDVVSGAGGVVVQNAKRAGPAAHAGASRCRRTDGKSGGERRLPLDARLLKRQTPSSRSYRVYLIDAGGREGAGAPRRGQGDVAGQSVSAVPVVRDAVKSLEPERRARLRQRRGQAARSPAGARPRLGALFVVAEAPREEAHSATNALTQPRAGVREPSPWRWRCCWRPTCSRRVSAPLQAASSAPFSASRGGRARRRGRGDDDRG